MDQPDITIEKQIRIFTRRPAFRSDFNNAVEELMTIIRQTDETVLSALIQSKPILCHRLLTRIINAGTDEVLRGLLDLGFRADLKHIDYIFYQTSRLHDWRYYGPSDMYLPMLRSIFKYSEHIDHDLIERIFQQMKVFLEQSQLPLYDVFHNKLFSKHAESIFGFMPEPDLPIPIYNTSVDDPDRPGNYICSDINGIAADVYERIWLCENGIRSLTNIRLRSIHFDPTFRLVVRFFEGTYWQYRQSWPMHETAFQGVYDVYRAAIYGGAVPVYLYDSTIPLY